MAFETRYSTLVTWLKITLPLVALALLATLFLLSEPPDPDRALPYAEVDVAQRARELRLTQPRFAGVLTDGRELTLVARAATPEFDEDGQGRAVVFDGVSGRLGLGPDDLVTLAAPAGRINLVDQVASLSGGVVAQTEAGYRLTADRVQLNLSELGVAARVAVAVQGPGFDLTAGTMEVSGPEGATVLSFTGGIRLLYQAQQ